MMMVICFGEVMLRLGVPKGYRLEQVLPGTLYASFGGSEANVAALLARFGTAVHYVTALPPGPLTNAFVRELRGLGARVTVRETPGRRFGLYFVEHGVGPRGSSVVYDRDGSGVAESGLDGYEFDGLFTDAEVLHVTGITPALSKTACETVVQAVKMAKKNGIFVSCDLNYRAKLWRWDERKKGVDLARKWMPQIVEHVDLLIGNESDFSDALAIVPKHSVPEVDIIHAPDYEKMAIKASKAFPNLKYIASSLRASTSADINGWGGMLYDVKLQQAYFAPMKNGKYQPYELMVIDRFGAGDSFAGGLIHALFSRDMSESETALAFAVAASALKHTLYGDYNFASREEVMKLMQGDQAGRVQR